MVKHLLCIFTSVWIAAGSLYASAAEDNDLLDIANGAVLVTATSQYGEKWAAMMLLDGSTSMGWCSENGKPAPNTFLIELSQAFRIHSFCIDNTGVQEQGYPGISARSFKLYLSNDSAESGFQLICEGEAAKGERRSFDLEGAVAGQWLKLEILSNWGHSGYTELMELEAYGEPVGETVARAPIQGVFDTNYKLLWLEQSGNQIEGCYDWDGGRLAGTTDGRVIRFQWTEHGPQIGTALMVLTSDGFFLNGLWYEKGAYQGLWYGKRVTDGRSPLCRQAAEQAMRGGDSFGRALDDTGRAILYGIYFDHDSSDIRQDSEETLNRVFAAVKARPNLKLVVEGHTDSNGSDEYNLKLSDRRARSVVAWLVLRGIESGRLQAAGFGESRPVADNGKPDGRALNRRVEMAVVK